VDSRRQISRHKVCLPVAVVKLPHWHGKYESTVYSHLYRSSQSAGIANGEQNCNICPFQLSPVPAGISLRSAAHVQRDSLYLTEHFGDWTIAELYGSIDQLAPRGTEVGILTTFMSHYGYKARNLYYRVWPPSTGKVDLCTSVNASDVHVIPTIANEILYSNQRWRSMTGSAKGQPNIWASGKKWQCNHNGYSVFGGTSKTEGRV